MTPDTIESFISQGFVRIDNAFSRELAEAACDILWQETGCDRNDPKTWMQPVIRLGQYGAPPFVEAANTPVLHAAFNALVGKDLWRPRPTLGTFPVRFPSEVSPGDDGWHIDTSFDGHLPNFLDWRANIHSRGRSLLMLLLFSDIGKDDAPTRIRAASHIDIARRLAPAGEAGLTLGDLAATGFDDSAGRPEVLATGSAGTVYLCHPFLVHAAQPHRGRTPRFLAQPPLLPVQLNGATGAVGLAIKRALAAS